jgi:hypothetical protein
LSDPSKDISNANKGSPLIGSKGNELSPTINRYEILFNGENIPTSKIVEILRFNAGTYFKVLILEENLEFVSSPEVKSNMPKKYEEMPHSPFKYIHHPGTYPNQHNLPQ